MKRIALLVFLPVAAFAQAPQPPAPAAQMPQQVNQPLWRAQLPGGTYEVAVRAIISVSTHEYVVDGATRVTEVNIDTAGSLLARFYFLEPNTPTPPVGASTLDRIQQLTTETAEKTGQDVWKRVVKNYPTTTHARTVEYRLETKEQLQKLFESAESAFRLGKNTTFRVE